MICISVKTVFKNASYLFVSNVIIRIITAATTILVARTLGAEDYGVLSLSLAFAAVAGYFTDVGLTHTLIREATKENANLPVLMSSFFKVRLLLAIFTCICCTILMEILYGNTNFKIVLYLVVMPSIFGAAIQGVGAAYFQVIEKMHITALIRTIAGLVISLSLALGIVFSWNLKILGFAYGISGIIAGIISLVLVLRRIHIFTGWNNNILKGLSSFTVSGFIIMLLPQLGLVILEMVSSLKEVGHFALAYRIPSVLYQLPGVVALAFYPLLFRYGNSGMLRDHRQLNIIQLKLMSHLGILMSIPFLLYPDWWTLLLFGDNWLEVSASLSILSVLVIIQAISYPIADALTTTGFQARRMKVLFVGVITSLPVYIILGAKYGSVGAASAAIVTEVIILLGFSISIKKSLSLLFKGLSYNLLSLTITVLIHYIVLVKIYPLIANVLALIAFSGTSVFLDKDLRRRIVSWIQARNLRSQGDSIEN